MDIDRNNVFSVSEINLHIKHILENSIPQLLVEGEIANFTRHRSGHIYFSLKDENSSIRCVFFRSYAQSLDFNPKEGDKVICKGKITVFERAGNYQLNVIKMIPSGIGELQLKFEKLKAKLKEEGLFDIKYKKELPKFPKVVGVVTSSSGAAIRDIKKVISRRFPIKILLYPANVQGEKAAKEIIEGIRYFNLKKNVDVIIIGRGGGSQEDLFCFNDENLAYEIFKSEIQRWRKSEKQRTLNTDDLHVVCLQVVFRGVVSNSPKRIGEDFVSEQSVQKIFTVHEIDLWLGFQNKLFFGRVNNRG